MLVLIGALTPLSEAVRQTGGTDLIAAGLAGLLHGDAAARRLGRADDRVDGLLALPAQRADRAGARRRSALRWPSGSTSTPIPS